MDNFIRECYIDDAKYIQALNDKLIFKGAKNGDH